MKHFVDAIEFYNKKGHSIAIFPEAHIWPYYNDIRPFQSKSFLYPVKLNSPVVAYCTVFSKPTGIFKRFRKANIKIYISEPFYPDTSLSVKEAQQKIRDEVYDFMKTTADKYSTYSVIDYIYKPTEETYEEAKKELVLK